MGERWVEANREAERKGDWRPLADFYADDATYGWNIGPEGRRDVRRPRGDPRRGARA